MNIIHAYVHTGVTFEVNLLFVMHNIDNKLTPPTEKKDRYVYS